MFVNHLIKIRNQSSVFNIRLWIEVINLMAQCDEFEIKQDHFQGVSSSTYLKKRPRAKHILLIF